MFNLKKSDSTIFMNIGSNAGASDKKLALRLFVVLHLDSLVRLLEK